MAWIPRIESGAGSASAGMTDRRNRPEKKITASLWGQIRLCRNSSGTFQQPVTPDPDPVSMLKG